MAEAVADIAEHEERDATKVLADLLIGDADVVRFQLDDDSLSDGTIPIAEGLNLFGGARKALLAAACSVVDPKPYYARLSRAEATQFINACRMSSERGSFIARIICPLDADVADPAQSHLNDNSPLPFTRRVTSTLMHALDALVQGAEHDDLDRLLDESATGPLSANLCDALLAMQPSGRQAKLRVESTWAAVAGPPPSGLGRIDLHQEHFAAVEELANRLRPTQRPEQSAFIGTVVALSGTPGSDGEVQGEATLQIYDGEDLIKARAVLTHEDYKKAVQAHLTNTQVRIWGELRRRARIHLVTRYQRFELTDANDAQASAGMGPAGQA